GATGRDSDRYGDDTEPLAGRPPLQLAAHDPETQALGNRNRALQPGIWKQDRKLLASVSGREILSFDRLGEHRSDQAQHAVAGEVTVAIIEPFEGVDVDHQEGERGPVGLSLRNRLLERTIEATAIGKRSQCIAARLD